MSPNGAMRAEVGDKPVTIGRHPENAVVLSDAKASRFHCVIARAKDDAFIIRDLDSRNGTWLNEERITTAALRKSDTIRIGSTKIRLVLTPASAQPAGDQVRTTPPVPPSPALPPAPPPAAKPMASPAAPPPPKPAQDAATMGEDKEEDPLALLAAMEQAASPSPTRAAPEEQSLEELSLDGEDALVDLSSTSGHQDDERFLPVLAGSLPDQSFEAEDIALINTRGQLIHPPVPASQRTGRAAKNVGEGVTILRQILLICCRARATDIHLEPKNDDYLLRLRIDGSLADVVRITKPMGVRLSTMIKVLCEIDLQFRNIIQEGHFSAGVGGRRVDYRVSFVPSIFGQKLVVRVLDVTHAPLHLPDLHMPMWMLEEIQHASEADSGMILVVGPTGSGKTTTLYATLRDVDTAGRNVVTIEDPVEIEIPGVTQVPVNDEQGNTFPALLRSMLRQDPDVIMVGEIRDAETAGIAVQASMTGHLVLSTLHAKDTIGTIFRLLDLGLEPYLLSSCLQIVVAQRLVRQLCSYCKKGVDPTPEQARRMEKWGQGLGKIYVPVGCPRCLKTGYAGRRAIFEMITATDKLREMILEKPGPKEIEQAMAGTRFARLTEAGYHLVAEGLTAFDEVEKVIGRV